MSKTSNIFLTAALSLAATSAQANSLQQMHDVAINPMTGENFVVQMDMSPDAKVVMLSDRNETYRETIQLPAQAGQVTRVEIELSSPTTLTYLVQSQDSWTVNALVKGANGWQALPASQALHGVGHASELRSLPEGRIMAKIENGLADPRIVVAAQTTAGVKELGSVANSDYQARYNEMIQSISTAEATSSSTGESWGMGFTAGALSGVGVAYRRHLANNWGYQIGGIAFGDKSSVMTSLGSTLMYTFNKSQSARFYALAGLGTFFQGNVNHYPVYSCPPDVPVEQCKANEPVVREPEGSWSTNLNINFGIGIGIEWYLVQNLGLVLELPISAMLNFRNTGAEFGGIYPIPNASLVYYFM